MGLSVGIGRWSNWGGKKPHLHQIFCNLSLFNIRNPHQLDVSNEPLLHKLYSGFAISARQQILSKFKDRCRTTSVGRLGLNNFLVICHQNYILMFSALCVRIVERK